jgi:hypothetical protein
MDRHMAVGLPQSVILAVVGVGAFFARIGVLFAIGALFADGPCSRYRPRVTPRLR